MILNNIASYNINKATKYDVFISLKWLWILFIE